MEATPGGPPRDQPLGYGSWPTSWDYCNVLGVEGVSAIEYTKQLPYLHFLKMAHERETRRLKAERHLPAHCSRPRLVDADGDGPEITYWHVPPPRHGRS